MVEPQLTQACGIAGLRRADHRPSAGGGRGVTLGPAGWRVDELPSGLQGVPRHAALQEALPHAQDPHLARGVRQARVERVCHPLHPRLDLRPGRLLRQGRVGRPHPLILVTCVCRVPIFSNLSSHHLTTRKCRLYRPSHFSPIGGLLLSLPHQLL